MHFRIRNLIPLVIILILAVLGISVFACTENPTTQAKASSLLLYQISLRNQQLASPNPERLTQMQAQGMDTAKLNIQRIYVYLKQQLTPDQTGELQEMGITIYINSWIPPVGNNPNGFYLADMPVDKLDALAAKDYIVSLDTAERPSQPQPDVSIGG